MWRCPISIYGIIAIAVSVGVAKLAYGGFFTSTLALLIWSWYAPLVRKVAGSEFMPSSDADELSMQEITKAFAPLFRLAELESGIRKLAALQSHGVAAG